MARRGRKITLRRVAYKKAFIIITLSLVPAFGSAQEQLSASERMTELGPEGQALAKRVGT